MYKKDGTNTYFDSLGRTVAIKDKYDNIIKYFYLTNQIKIEDTVGRIVTYSKETLAGGHKVVVRIQEDAVSKTLQTYEVIDGQLINIIDEFGNTTRIDYYAQDFYTNYFSPNDIDNGTSYDEYLGTFITYDLIDSIWFPTGAMLSYYFQKDYMYYGISCGYQPDDGRHRIGEVYNCTADDHGIKAYPQAVSRGEAVVDENEDWIDDFNFVSISYPDETRAENCNRWGDNYTGYPTRYGYTFPFKVAIENDFLTKDIYTFPVSYPAWQGEDAEGYVPTSVETHIIEFFDQFYHPGKGELRSKTTFSYYGKARLPASQQTTLYENSNSFITNSEAKTYDDYGNILTHPPHRNFCRVGTFIDYIRIKW